MAELKLVIGQKDGKCVQKQLSADDSQHFLGKTIGTTIKGEVIGLTGYEFLITGGSDNCGFPMRKDAPGTGRKRILIVPGTVGVRKKSKSKRARTRKTVCGNTIFADTAQINLKILKVGKQQLVEAPAEEKPAEGEAPKEEKKAEEKKAEPAKEEKKPEPVKEKPAEEKKPEPVKEAPKEEKPAEKKE